MRARALMAREKREHRFRYCRKHVYTHTNTNIYLYRRPYIVYLVHFIQMDTVETVAKTHNGPKVQKNNVINKFGQTLWYTILYIAKNTYKPYVIKNVIDTFEILYKLYYIFY